MAFLMNDEKKNLALNENIRLDVSIEIPLIVDLDGTLVLSDTLHESVARFFFQNPFLNLFKMLVWLFYGKAKFKEQLSLQTNIRPELLPYNQPFLDWIKIQKETGRKLFLCTAAGKAIADKVSIHLNIFDEVFCSSAISNNSAKKKALFLKDKFGENNYIYAGNSFDDIRVWENAAKKIVVNPSSALKTKLKNANPQYIFFPSEKKILFSFLKPLRIHQWAKNLLIFFPLIAAHQLYNLDNILMLFGAFFSISLCASSTYIINDIIDLDSDRLHPRKKYRSFASGEIPLQFALLILLMLPASIFLSSMIGKNFMIILLLYILLTISYSLFLKIIPVIDCIVLAALYTIRIIAGALVIDNTPSFWLIAFSILFFFSLAFLKRYSELLSAKNLGETIIHGRGYFSSDSPLILSLGVSSALGSVIVMMLYLNSPEILQLYNYPEIVWFTIPILLFWISYIWLQANRGHMHDDPVIFAIKDHVSILSAIAFFICIILGARGF